MRHGPPLSVQASARASHWRDLAAQDAGDPFNRPIDRRPRKRRDDRPRGSAISSWATRALHGLQTLADGQAVAIGTLHVNKHHVRLHRVRIDRQAWDIRQTNRETFRILDGLQRGVRDDGPAPCRAAAASTPDCRIAPPNILRKRATRAMVPWSPTTADPAGAAFGEAARHGVEVLGVVGLWPVAAHALPGAHAPSRCRRSPSSRPFAVTRSTCCKGQTLPPPRLWRVLDEQQPSARRMDAFRAKEGFGPGQRRTARVHLALGEPCSPKGREGDPVS